MDRFILRLLWLFTSPFKVALMFPFLIAHLAWCLIAWLATGKDIFLNDATPMTFVTSGWRWSAFNWPLPKRDWLA